jgi:hypothetical protein
MKTSLLLLLASLLPAATLWSATARSEIPNAAQPQLAVGADGRVWLAFGRLEAAPAPKSGEHGKHKGHANAERSGDVFVTWSNDGGASFVTPVKVASVPKLMLGMRRGPRLAVHGERVAITVIGAELLAYASSDGGKTWGGAVTVNDVPQSAREGLHDMTVSPDGQLFVTWLDLRAGKTELWSTTSRDGGRTWAKNEQVYRSPDTTICECCHPTALFDADGNLAVMWRNAIQGNRDMWMAVRPKGAAQFSAAKKLGQGTWQLNACPMDGGRIVALGGGKFAAVWQRAGEVFYSASEGAETRLGKGKQPVGISGGNSVRVLWQDGADLVAANLPAENNVHRIAADARFAVAVNASKPNATLIAYEQGPAKTPSLVVEVLP